MRSLMPYLVSLILAATCAAQEDVETFPCNTTDLWSVVEPEEKGPLAAELAVVDDAVSMSYERSRFTVLYHNVPMYRLTGMELVLRSNESGSFLLVVEDSGMGFGRPIGLIGGETTRVTVWPSEFHLIERREELADPPINPETLRMGYALVDQGAGAGASGPNKLAVAEVSIRHRGFDRRYECGLDVASPLEITEDTLVVGDVRVRSGSHLELRTRRFAVTGNVIVEGATDTLQAGSLGVMGGIVELRGTFAYSSLVRLGLGARAALRSTVVYSRTASGVSLADMSEVSAGNVDFPRGLTWDLREETSVSLQSCTTPGEFITSRRGHLGLFGCSGILVWLWIEADRIPSLKFPPSETVDLWRPEEATGYPISMESCRSCIFGTIAGPGCDVRVEDSRLAASGFFFDGLGVATVSDIANGWDPEQRLAMRFPLCDRQVTYYHTNVKAWNFYTEDSARLTIARSTFGEAHAGGFSRIVIQQSTCDGTGGFIQSSDDAGIEIHDSTITTLVQARAGGSTFDPAWIWLDRCVVVGDVVAAEGAILSAQGSTITGTVEASGGAGMELVNCTIHGEIVAKTGAVIVLEGCTFDPSRLVRNGGTIDIR